MSQQKQTAGFIGWLLIGMALMLLVPKLPTAIDLIKVRMEQDSKQIPADRPPVPDPNRRFRNEPQR